MTVYHLWRCDDDDADSYWVTAPTPEKARRLVALNIDIASDADDPMRFDCAPTNSKGKEPPAGLIYCRLSGPKAITRL
jgi:hypothetical protein